VRKKTRARGRKKEGGDTKPETLLSRRVKGKKSKERGGGAFGVLKKKLQVKYKWCRAGLQGGRTAIRKGKVSKGVTSQRG